MQENEQIRARAAAQGLSRSTERTGMFTTALVVRVGERLIALYYSGRAHAGENLAALLHKREADQAPPLAMSDALSRNEVEDGLVVRCHCLAHGRRQFSDLEEMFPGECRVVIETLKQVFDHEEVAREQAMSPAARLAYHQAYSKPLIDDLKVWLDQQIDDRLVEPNSALGKAITYMRTYWETLTRFLHIEKAPLGRVEHWRGGLGRRLSSPLSAWFPGGATVSRPCPVSSALSSNRTCGSPASGSHPGPHVFALDRPLLCSGGLKRPSVL
jgi:hypothetical protein